MLWVILFGSFAAAVGYNAKQAGLVDNIYRPEALYQIDKIKPPWKPSAQALPELRCTALDRR